MGERAYQEQLEIQNQSKFSLQNIGLLTSRLVAQGSGITSWQVAEQLYRIQRENAAQSFQLTDDQQKDFSHRGILRLFEIRNMECPVLWIRIDPNNETLGRVKV